VTRSAVPTRSFSALQRAEIAEITLGRWWGNYDFSVSVLFNEPKLLKCRSAARQTRRQTRVSVLFNEPKLLKCCGARGSTWAATVSVLFNEPKLLK